MHYKSEEFGIFIKFKTLVENMFFSKIKALQSDGGGEYTKHTFQQFLVTHGIQFRSFCPTHSEQNGLAECKYHHIVEIGLTLLAHSHASFLLGRCV